MHRKSIFFLNLLYGRCVLVGDRARIHNSDMRNMRTKGGKHIIVDPFNYTSFIYKKGRQNNERFPKAVKNIFLRNLFVYVLKKTKFEIFSFLQLF